MQCLGTCFQRIWEDRWATAAGGTLAHLFPLPGTHAPCAAYEKGGQFEKALRTFQHQLDAKVDPDLITFSSLVSACVRAGETRGEVSGAGTGFNHLMRQHLTIFFTHSAAGQLETAIGMLEVTHNFGLSGTQQMYYAVIAAANSWEAVLEVFLGMQCAQVWQRYGRNCCNECVCLESEAGVHAMSDSRIWVCETRE